MTDVAETNLKSFSVTTDSAGSEQADFVNAAEFLSNADVQPTPDNPSSDSSEEVAAQPEQKPDVDEQGAAVKQAQIDAIVKRRLAAERNKPAYKLGYDIVREVMQSENLNEAQAVEKIRNDRLEAKVRSYNGDNAKFMRDMLKAREEQPKAVEDPQPVATPESTVTLYQQLQDERANGLIPPDFDLPQHLKTNAKQFLSDRAKFGVAAAVEMAKRVASAPSVTNNVAEQNRKLPKPIGTNNAPKVRSIDYSALDSSDFKKLEAQIKREAASGKKVKL